MRALDDATLSAQSRPDALATVTVRCKRRSTFAGDPLVWRPIFMHTAANLPYGDINVTAAACACAEAGAMVRVLRSAAANKVGVQRFNVLNWSGSGTSWPSTARTELTRTPVQVGTLASTNTEESTPGVGRIGSEIRIVYGDGPKLYMAKSLDDGRTWSPPVMVYDSGLQYGRLSNISLCGAGATWICVFSGYNPKRLARVRGMHDAGEGWVVWPELPSYTDWQVAGARVGPEAAPNNCVYAYLWGADNGCNTLACQQVMVTSGGVFSSWGTRAVVDRAGVTGAASYGRVRFGEGGGAYLFALQERAVKGYWFVAALYALPGNADMEEPVYLAEADGAAAGPANFETLTPLACGRRAWLVGAGQVWTSAQTDAAVDLAVRTYTPISYRYEAGISGGGQLALRLPRTISAGDAIEAFRGIYPPEVYVGDILWLDRTLACGEEGGTQMLVFRVAAVRYTRSCIEVLALDALGVLAHMRPRRGKVLAENDRLRMGDVEAMCHWAGLKTHGAGTLPRAVYPSPGFVWPANESGLGALRRYLADQAVVLRSAGADTDQDHTHVAILPLPAESIYTYVSPNGLAEGYGLHELTDWELSHDGRDVRLFVAMGLRARNSAVSGEGWAMVPVRPRDGTRPVPLVAVDRSMAADDGTLVDRATAEAQRLYAGLTFGWIEVSANLGIELYDVITVDATDVRVVKIVETWDKGRLRQRLDLAEVNTYGVSVG
jgi:hypothetical protein